MTTSEVQSIFFGILGGIIPMVATVAGVVNWINAKFDLLKTRQVDGDARQALETEKLRSIIESNRAAAISDREMAEYRINANTELIGHRTERFCKELEQLEKRLAADIDDLKGYLAKTSDFKIRGRE